MAAIKPNWPEQIPAGLQTKQFLLRMLTIHDLVKDYDAVMVSREQLQGVFGPDSDWPRADLSLEQDLIDLGWHQKEFQNRSSFAYTVMAIDESQCLGCVYVYPSHHPAYEACVVLWARTGSDIESELWQCVQNWLEESWLFSKVAYPGRLISWQAYLQRGEG